MSSELTSKERSESILDARRRIQVKFGIPVRYSDIKIYKVDSRRIIFKCKPNIVLIIDRKQEGVMLKQIKKLQKESFSLGALAGSAILSAGGLLDGIITNDPFSAGLSLLVGLGVLGITAVASRKCLNVGIKEFSEKTIELAKDIKEGK